MAPVVVPPELEAAYRLLSTDFGHVTVGYSCGITGSGTSGSAAMDLLEKSGRLDLARNVARSLNTGGRVYAAIVLERLGNEEDRSLVRKLRDMPAEIETCGGCMITTGSPSEFL